MKISNTRLSGGYKISIANKDGKVIKSVEKCFDDLILQNFSMLLEGLFSSGGTGSGGTGYANLTDTSGTLHEVTELNLQECTGEAAENDDSYGIVIGSGTTSVSGTDYSLANKISNSVLQYGACTFNNFGTGTNYKPGLVRKFTNNGSSNVTVNEIGFVVKMVVTEKSGSTATIYVMLMRDVINAVTVPPGGILNIEYYFNLNPSS